jgi:hypothetical protein
MLNKKAQLDFGIVSFVAIVILIFMLGPILLQLVTTPITQFTNAINTTSPTAATTGKTIQSTFLGFWDVVLVSAYLVMTIMLLLSAFLIDTHPVFMVLYIIVCFLMILFLPNLSDTVQSVWNQYPTETNYIPMTQWLLDHITAVTLCIMVLSGIIMYAKIKSNQNGY